MSKEGHAPAACTKVQQAAAKIDHKEFDDNQPGRQREHRPKKEPQRQKRIQNHHRRRRSKRPECGQHARDGARRANHGYDGLGGQYRVAKRSEYATAKVERGEAPWPQYVFDIVSEDPQEEHVAADVSPAGVKEHAAAQREHFEDRLRPKPLGNNTPAGQDQAAIGFAEHQHANEHHGVCRDESVRHDRLATWPQVVLQGDHQIKITTLGWACTRCCPRRPRAQTLH